METTDKTITGTEKAPKSLIIGILRILVAIFSVGMVKIRPYDENKPYNCERIMLGLLVIMIEPLSLAALLLGAVYAFISYRWGLFAISALIALVWPLIGFICRFTPYTISKKELWERKQDAASAYMEENIMFSLFMWRSSLCAGITILLTVASAYTNDTWNFNVWQYIGLHWLWVLSGIALITLPRLIKNQAIGLGFSRFIYFFLSFGLNKIDISEAEYIIHSSNRDRWSEIRLSLFKGVMFTLLLDILLAANIYTTILYFRTGHYWPIFIMAGVDIVMFITKQYTWRGKKRRNRLADTLFGGFMKYKFSKYDNIHALIINIMETLFVLFSVLYVLPQEAIGYNVIWLFLTKHLPYVIGGVVAIILMYFNRGWLKRRFVSLRNTKQITNLFDLSDDRQFKHLARKLCYADFKLVGDFLAENWKDSKRWCTIMDRAIYRFIYQMSCDAVTNEVNYAVQRYTKVYNPKALKAFAYLAGIMKQKGEFREDYLDNLLTAFAEATSDEIMDMLRPFDGIKFKKTNIEKQPLWIAHQNRDIELKTRELNETAARILAKQEWEKNLTSGDVTAFLAIDHGNIKDKTLQRLLLRYFQNYSPKNIPDSIFHFSKVKKEAIWSGDLDRLFTLMSIIYDKSYNDDLLLAITKAQVATLNYLESFLSQVINNSALKRFLRNREDIF